MICTNNGLLILWLKTHRGLTTLLPTPLQRCCCCLCVSLFGLWRLVSCCPLYFVVNDRSIKFVSQIKNWTWLLMWTLFFFYFFNLRLPTNPSTEARHRHWADQEGSRQDHRRNHFQDPERTLRGDQRKGGEYAIRKYVNSCRMTIYSICYSFCYSL